MPMDRDEILRVLRAFNDAGLEYTLIGATAMVETVAREIKEVSGTMVAVATPAALYRMKKDTVRAKDHQDAMALRERFQIEDDQ